MAHAPHRTLGVNPLKAMFPIIDLARHLLETQIDHLRSIEAIAEQAFARHDAGVDAWYEERRMVVDDDENAEDRDYLNELFQSQKVEAKEVYPQLARASLFATGYGLLEHFMVSVCRHSERHLKGPALKDLRGEGIHRARLYLSKVANLDFPEKQEWYDLTTYGALRNALVHAQGDLSTSGRAEEIEKLAARIATFKIAPDRTRVILSGSFNDRYLGTVEQFARQLDEAWKNFPGA